MRQKGIRAPRSIDMMAFLDEPESVWVLGQSKLRNGLVHLGLEDIASSLETGNTIHDAVRAYTGLESNEVAARTVNHLARFVSLLTSWMLSPTADGKFFLSALQPAALA